VFIVKFCNTPHHAFLQQEAVQTIPWPAVSPDMNPIEHVWDFIGRKINQHNPKCQNVDELRTAILQECKKCWTIRALCGLALSSMNIGLSANA
jgi:hypothetical protein